MIGVDVHVSNLVINIIGIGGSGILPEQVKSVSVQSIYADL